MSLQCLRATPESCQEHGHQLAHASSPASTTFAPLPCRPVPSHGCVGRSLENPTAAHLLPLFSSWHPCTRRSHCSGAVSCPISVHSPTPGRLCPAHAGHPSALRSPPLPPPRPRRTSLFPSFSLRPGRDEPEARSSLPSPSWGAWPGDAVTPSSPARGAWCSRAGNQDFIPNAVIRTVTLLRETNRGLKHVMSSLEHTVHLWRTDTFTYISSL